MELAKQKAELRKQAAQNCAQCARQHGRQDEAILARLLSLPEYQRANTMFCYVSVKQEVDTRAFIERALREGKKVAVPRCISLGIMEMRQITSLAELQPAAFGLLEPADNCPVVAEAQIDLAVVPAAACDEHCNRLGKGGGFYDRTLAHRIYPAVALCREAALFTRLPCEPWDQPVDIVLTEKNTLRKTIDNTPGII